VAGTNLFPDESEFTPRPAWQVIEAARRQQLSGELTLQTTPATRIYLRDGIVYFAERSTDGTLAIRLLVEGVINREQMQRGTVIVNGVEHVGRMFEADPSIDRASVELCSELFTDDVMVDVANRNVQSYEMVLYKRHPSGIDRWYPQPGHGGRQVDQLPAEPEPAAVAQPAPPTFAKPAMAPIPEPMPEPKSTLGPPPLTLSIPVTKPATPPAPPPNVTQQVPITPFVSTVPPLTKLADPKPTLQMPMIPLGTPTATDTDASGIADEVAEAIKRAFSGLGA
jgi:hypothetical protein